MYKQVNIAKTYACKNAITISSPLSAIKKAMGSNPPIIKEFAAKTNTKPPITFNNVCPAIIFANNLTERLIGLDMYDMISIGINKTNMGFGTPLGENKPKNFIRPCL